jgi:hypothetical protein
VCVLFACVAIKTEEREKRKKGLIQSLELFC